jgi:hypothetical protein
MSGQIIQVQSGQTQVMIGKGVYTALDKLIVSRREFNKIEAGAFTSILTDLGPGILTSAPVNLSSISADATTYATITPGFAGRLSAVFAIVTTAATTAAKAATLQAFIDQDAGGSAANTAVSGGVISLTSANATPAGKILSGSRIVWSAANPMDFAKDAVITFRTTAAPTTFVEGAVVFGVILDAQPTVSTGTGPLLV